MIVLGIARCDSRAIPSTMSPFGVVPQCWFDDDDDDGSWTMIWQCWCWKENVSVVVDAAAVAAVVVADSKPGSGSPPPRCAVQNVVAVVVVAVLVHFPAAVAVDAVPRAMAFSVEFRRPSICVPHGWLDSAIPPQPVETNCC